jgi:hypothetical protein
MAERIAATTSEGQAAARQHEAEVVPKTRLDVLPMLLVPLLALAALPLVGSGSSWG